MLFATLSIADVSCKCLTSFNVYTIFVFVGTVLMRKACWGWLFWQLLWCECVTWHLTIEKLSRNFLTLAAHCRNELRVSALFFYFNHLDSTSFHHKCRLFRFFLNILTASISILYRKNFVSMNLVPSTNSECNMRRKYIPSLILSNIL